MAQFLQDPLAAIFYGQTCHGITKGDQETSEAISPCTKSRLRTGWAGSASWVVRSPLFAPFALKQPAQIGPACQSGASLSHHQATLVPRPRALRRPG